MLYSIPSHPTLLTLSPPPPSLTQVFVDLNDEHVFTKRKLFDMLTESKTVLYFPDFLLQCSRSDIISHFSNFYIKLEEIKEINRKSYFLPAF